MSLFLSRELVSNADGRSAYLIHQHDLESFPLAGLPYRHLTQRAQCGP
jgi:hypothetical protein